MFVAKQTLGALVILGWAAVSSWAAVMEGSAAHSKLTFGGDLRLRHESFYNKTLNQPDRHRQRMRLRFGVQAEMEKWEAAFRLASGSGEQSSTNQTFTNSFSGKGIYIDQAFAAYKPWDGVKLQGGKLINPFWRAYSSDLVWDSDITPEGLAQLLTYRMSGNLTLFGNFAQLPLFENSNDYRDPYLIGNQIGMQTQVGQRVGWTFAVASYIPTYEEASVLISTTAFSNDPQSDQPSIQGDNRRVPGTSQLVGSYHMVNFTTEFAFQLGLPVRVQGDFLRNVSGARINNQATGYQAGLIVNAAKTAGSWEAAYFNKFVEAHATLSDLSDSDWGNGGTNRKGHIVWVAYAVTDFVTLQSKYMTTKRVDPFIGASAPYAPSAAAVPRDINRFQVDVNVKF